MIFHISNTDDTKGDVYVPELSRSVLKVVDGVSKKKAVELGIKFSFNSSPEFSFTLGNFVHRHRSIVELDDTHRPIDNLPSTIIKPWFFAARHHTQ